MGRKVFSFGLDCAQLVQKLMTGLGNAQIKTTCGGTTSNIAKPSSRRRENEMQQLRPGEIMLSSDTEMYLKRRCDELGKALLKANKRAELYKLAYQRLAAAIGLGCSELEKSRDELTQLFEPTRDSASPVAAHPSIETEVLRSSDTAPDTLRSAQLPPVSSDDREPGVQLCPSTQRLLRQSDLQADATKLS